MTQENKNKKTYGVAQPFHIQKNIKEENYVN